MNESFIFANRNPQIIIPRDNRETFHLKDCFLEIHKRYNFENINWFIFLGTTRYLGN